MSAISEASGESPATVAKVAAQVGRVAADAPALISATTRVISGGGA